MRRFLIAVVALAVAVAVAGCGSDDSGGEEASSDVAGLVELLTSDAPAGYGAIDMTAAREALELPEDAAPAIGEGDAETRFAAAAAFALPYLAEPNPPTIAEALDVGQITAAASTIGFYEGSLTVAETEQSFDEVAGVLEGAGYTREGDVLFNEDGFSRITGDFYAAVAGGDGVIAMGQDRELVEAAAAGEKASSTAEAATLAGELALPAAAAVDGDTCASAYAVSDQLAEGRGEFVIVTAEPDPEGFRLEEDESSDEGSGSFLPGYQFEFEEPVVEGDRLVVPFVYPLGEPGGPVMILNADLPAGTIYSCAADTA